MPSLSNYPGSADTWASVTARSGTALSNGSQTQVIQKIQDALAVVLPAIGYNSSPNEDPFGALMTGTKSIYSRLAHMMYTTGFPVQLAGVAPGNSATANGTALQNLINLAEFLASLSSSTANMTLLFDQGHYNLQGTAGSPTIEITQSNIWLQGHTMWDTVLEMHGHQAGDALISIHGSEGGALYSGHLFGCGLKNLGLNNAGASSDVNGIYLAAMQGFTLDHVHGMGAFRRHLLQMQNVQDSQFYQLESDFNGSANDTNNAIIDIGVGTSTEDACNSLRFYGGRIENISDRILSIVGSGGHRCNKIHFHDFKMESSTVDGNGLAGTDSQIYLKSCDTINFVDLETTLQQLQGNGTSPTHAVIPSMFHVDGDCNNIKWARHQISSSLATKVFTRIYNMDSTNAANSGCTWTDIGVNYANSAALPTHGYLWTNTNGNNLMHRSGIFGGPIAGGTLTTDSGSPSSTTAI